MTLTHLPLYALSRSLTCAPGPFLVRVRYLEPVAYPFAVMLKYKEACTVPVHSIHHVRLYTHSDSGRAVNDLSIPKVYTYILICYANARLYALLGNRNKIHVEHIHQGNNVPLPSCAREPSTYLFVDVLSTRLSAFSEGFRLSLLFFPFPCPFPRESVWFLIIYLFFSFSLRCRHGICINKIS